jgi:dihydrofolate reductase
MRTIVFSNTLSRAEWNNAALVKEIVPEEIINMKQEPGRDMVIYGSASIVRTLTNLGLIDRYNLLFYPVVARERQASLSRHRAQGEAFACQHQDTPFRSRGTLLPADKVFPALMPANSGLACMLFSVSTRLNRRSTR